MDDGLKFIRERLTELRMQKGISEAEMSRSLGHAKGYIQEVSSGRRTLPMKEFFNVCDYLDVTPEEFFVTEFSDIERRKSIRILNQYFLTLSAKSLKHLADAVETETGADDPDRED